MILQNVRDYLTNNALYYVTTAVRRKCDRSESFLQADGVLTHMLSGEINGLLNWISKLNVRFDAFFFRYLDGCSCDWISV